MESFSQLFGQTLRVLEHTYDKRSLKVDAIVREVLSQQQSKENHALLVPIYTSYALFYIDYLASRSTRDINGQEKGSEDMVALRGLLRFFGAKDVDSVINTLKDRLKDREAMRE